jgi:hypothetical protein
MRQDTRQLLRIGVGTFLTGELAAAATLTICGGVSKQGPHTNSGWLMLMLAMGCLPMGALMLLLAVAKLVGDRRR